MTAATAPAVSSAYSRANPFPALFAENRRLNGAASDKDTRHFVVRLEDSGLSYKVGDSLGVFAKNPPRLVDDLIARLRLDPETPVADEKAGTFSLREALSAFYTLNRAGKKFVKGLVDRVPDGPNKTQLQELVANDEALTAYIFDRDYIDILTEYSDVSLTAEELVGLLTKSAPRLYSIASSPDKHPGEVHLTVAVVRYVTHGREKYGLASGFMAEFLPVGERIPVFVQSAKHFHLPASGDTDIIMVGPGTGIAPFRAFLEQREMDGAKGRNWLFFGDQHAATDYLYGDEFELARQRGLLSRVDLAFSRDQAHKIYVQHRMIEQGAELWRWLDGGAYFYVCGDAKRMAKDVHQALIEIAQTHGGLSPDAAKEFVEVRLQKTERRYMRDVY